MMEKKVEELIKEHGLEKVVKILEEFIAKNTPPQVKTVKPYESPKDALNVIVKNRHEKSLNWAVNYALCGLRMDEKSEEFRVQCLYVLGNISHWRGEEARRVRLTLKNFTKEK